MKCSLVERQILGRLQIPKDQEVPDKEEYILTAFRKDMLQGQK